MKALLLILALGLIRSLAGEPISPAALALGAKTQRLYVACATGNEVLELDLATRAILKRHPVPPSPSGLALTKNEDLLIITSAEAKSTITLLELPSGKVLRAMQAGHTAVAPLLSPDEKTLFFCNRFNNEVVFMSLECGEVIARVPAPREPVALAISLDGRHLFAANHIHAGRSDLDVVASSVTVIDVSARKALKDISLPNGSGLLRDVRISPDGKYACVTHLLSRFHLPTTQIERGWINNNALTLIDVAKLERINTVLLDNIDRGAANPWAAEWASGGNSILVTHAGTHEISLIDFPALLAKLAKLPAEIKPGTPVDYTSASRTLADVPNDLSFLVGVRKRIKLPEADRGPRAIATLDQTVYVANYFSDSITRVDFGPEVPRISSAALNDCNAPSPARLGEFYFNDATICFQGWQSCSSCHSSDARVDGLNWDNLNDGIGNPKNAKSLLLAHQTPPSMFLGVRSNAFVAVRAGIKNSLFTVQPEEVPKAIDEYLMSLKPIPSPYLVDGKMSAAAQRGEKLFFSDETGCGSCHKGPLFTDKKFHNAGTRSRYDKPADRFDTPTLVEVWRSAPYLHDGSAVTLRDVLTSRNADQLHGETGQLSPQEIEDLAIYVLSL